MVGRVRSDRVMRLPKPPRMAGVNGRPPKHGPEFRFTKPETWPEPAITTVTDTTNYGKAETQAWDRVHPRLTHRTAEVSNLSGHAGWCSRRPTMSPCRSGCRPATRQVRCGRRGRCVPQTGHRAGSRTSGRSQDRKVAPFGAWATGAVAPAVETMLSGQETSMSASPLGIVVRATRRPVLASNTS
jgi:DDE superfamily endonuclease